jgi:hypothetical protein
MITNWQADLQNLLQEEVDNALWSDQELTRLPGLAKALNPHIVLARHTFDTIRLVIARAHAQPGDPIPCVANRVCSQLLVQVAQDITAVSALIREGLAYQAVSIAASTYEHGVMLASIGNDNSRAQQWLDHPNQKVNIDNVKDRTALAVKKLDEKYPGLGDKLGDLYAGMYGPLCAFKHGNPMVQRHLGTQTVNGATHYSVYPVLDRKAVIAGCWAVETVIRVGWMGLVSFIHDHLADRSGLDDVMPGMNRGLTQLVEWRSQIEARQS